jgi:hypothetical protein
MNKRRTPGGIKKKVDAIRVCFQIIGDAFSGFNRDDGWAIAGYIAMSVLMAVFPFLIVVTALAGVVGSVNLADEVARLIFAAWPKEVASPLAGTYIKCLRRLAAAYSPWRCICSLLCFERRRQPAHWTQSRIRTQRGASVVVSEARIDWLRTGRFRRTTGSVSSRVGSADL